MSPRVRTRLAAALSGLAALALVAAIAAADIRHTAIDTDQFANRATVALQAPAVRDLVARRITDDLVIRNVDSLLAARPLIQSVISGALGGRALAGLLRSAVSDLHRAVLKRDESTVTLTVADVGTVAAAALDTLRPALAARLRTDNRAQLLRTNLGAVSTAALRLVDRVRLLALILAFVALLCAVAALGLAADRRRVVAGLGVSLAVAGALLVAAWTIGRTLVVDGVTGGEDRAAVGAIWDAFLDPVRTEAWLIAGAGAVLAAAAASLLHPTTPGARTRAAVRRLTLTPRSRGRRALRALVAVLVGVALLVDAGAVLAVLVTALGVGLIYLGVAELLDVTRPRDQARTPALARVPGWRAGLMTVGVAGIVAGAVAVFLGGGGLSVRGPRPAPCNGSQALCDRPLTDVALAATHNAMSAPGPGWYSVEQEAPIPEQLDAGIRGLLIDTYYADRLTDGRLRTDVSRKLDRANAEQLSPQVLKAAERLRARLGYRGSGTRGLYLCHGFCELGATRLATVLDEIHDFLVAHPEQVLVVINEDYVTAKSFVSAVNAAGLGSMAFTPPASGETWPTLRQMIDSGHRILFLAEHEAGGASWYRPAYRSLTEETPYRFTKASQLTAAGDRVASCRANRGPRSGAPLFLVNHWISTDPVPLAANAARVNALSSLLARLRTCERERHHIPNLVAVNFFREGDVLGAVDALNGVSASP